MLALIGLIKLFRGIGIVEIVRMPFIGGIGVPGPLFSEGTWSLLFAFALMNLLVLLEVADRLSLKNDLEIARDIQQAMLPSGVFSAPGVETFGMSRPANTVGGDFYDILPLDDGASGDRARRRRRQRQPGGAADGAAARDAAHARRRKARAGGARHAAQRAGLPPRAAARGSSRCSTRSIEPLTGELTYVSAGHMPPLLLRGDGTLRAADRRRHRARHVRALDLHDRAASMLQPDDLLAVYSDGITEAENPAGRRSTKSGSKPR